LKHNIEVQSTKISEQNQKNQHIKDPLATRRDPGLKIRAYGPN